MGHGRIQKGPSMVAFWPNESSGKQLWLSFAQYYNYEMVRFTELLSNPVLPTAVEQINVYHKQDVHFPVLLDIIYYCHSFLCSGFIYMTCEICAFSHWSAINVCQFVTYLKAEEPWFTSELCQWHIVSKRNNIDFLKQVLPFLQTNIKYYHRFCKVIYGSRFVIVPSSGNYTR
jgi:hypothetical protein